MLLRVAAGTVYGLSVAALKATVHAASQGVLAVFASGWLYLVIALGRGGCFSVSTPTAGPRLRPACPR